MSTLFDTTAYEAPPAVDPDATITTDGNVSTTITLPYMGESAHVGGFMASDAQRNEVLAVLFRQNGRSLDQLPPAYAEGGPLRRWCWLVLATNGITPEYRSDGSTYDLTHYGIDLGFSSTAVRKWIWYLA